MSIPIAIWLLNTLYEAFYQQKNKTLPVVTCQSSPSFNKCGRSFLPEWFSYLDLLFGKKYTSNNNHMCGYLIQSNSVSWVFTFIQY